MKGKNIGAGCSIVRKFWREVDDAHLEIRMYYAPSECHDLVHKHSRKVFRLIKKRVKGITGLNWRTFTKEVERRTSPRWMYFNRVESPTERR